MFLVVLDQSKLLIDESSIGILKDIELIFLLDCECMLLFFLQALSHCQTKVWMKSSP